MTPEVRAALKMAHEGFNHDNCPDHWPDCNAARVLAAEFLAANPADDDEAIDGRWLKQCGAIRPMAPCGDESWAIGTWQNGHYPISFSRPMRPMNAEWVIYVGGCSVYWERQDRWHLRRLAAALGITLTESTQQPTEQV